MRWSTPWRVLVGNRQAILEAASSRWSLAVGALLVLSASLARKYDTVDLLGEPHELMHGFAATVVNAFALHGLIWAFGADRPRPPFWSTYLAFLGVFWLASPMGWVYGIPYEQFLPAPDAVAANLWSLAAISLLRVLWVTRVLGVLWGTSGLKQSVGTFFIVMLYSDALAVIALLTAPLPTLDVMGGLQQPPEVRIVAGAAFQAGVVAVLSAPIWLIGGSAVLSAKGRRWSAGAAATGPAPRGALAAGLIAVVAWSALLPSMQPPARRRGIVESALKAGRYDEAAEELCRFERGDFPPVWNPPPRVEWGGHRDEEISLSALVEAIELQPRVPEWVAGVFGPKAIRRASRELGLYWDNVLGESHNGREVPQDPESGWRLVEAEDRADVLMLLEFVERRMPGLTGPQRARLRAWIEAGKKAAGVQNDGGAG